MITISFRADSSGKPLYIQLYESIKNDIIEKKLAPDSILPSKRSLSAHLNVSIKTIENAYSQLLLEGYIYSIEKKGYFVSELDDYRTSEKNRTSYQSKYVDENYLVDLKANKNDMKDFPISVWCRMMRETLAYDEAKLLDTVPFNGIAPLRIAIAKHLFAFRGMEVSPDQIIIGAGTEYLYMRLIQLFGRDTIYAVEDPGYTNIREIYKSNDVSYRAIPVDKDGICMEKLTRSNASIAHVSPAHHFPLGLVMPITRRLDLLQWANAAPNRYIIEDDYDSEYRYRGMPVPPLYNIDVREKVVYMNTFSKSIAPAVRISYMVLPEGLMEKYISKINFYSCSVSSFDQFTLAKFIEGNYLERHINRMKRSYVTKRNEIITAIKTSGLHSRTQIIEDAAGTHFLMKVDTALSDDELVSSLRRKKILVSSLSEYCEHQNPEYNSTLIINYSGITTAQIRYFINSLMEILD
jgi:GntR family transcriptional regulator/MocR family aminotransferase